MLATLSRIILLILSALIILGGSGWVVYYSLSRWFLFQSAERIALVIVIMGVILGFIGISVIARGLESVFVKYIYIAFAVLVGIYVFVFFSAILGWIVIGLLKLAGISLSYKILGIAIVTLAILYAGYNVWNAENIQIKNINVQIKNLPPQWKGKTIVQLSDIHLGNILGPNFLKKVIQMSDAQNPDIVAITGDLFDGMDGNLSAFIEPLNDIKAKKGIYFITGNHELYVGLDKVLKVLDQTKIQYIDNEIVHNDGLQIIGIAYGEDFQTQDIKKIITSHNDYVPEMPSILLYHIPLPSQIKAAKELGIGLQLSGHTHLGQLFPFKFITDIVYRGYDYGIRKEGDFTEYTSSGVGTWGPPMRSGNKPEIVVIHLE